MLYIKFALPFALWAWVLSSSYARYILPRISSVYGLLKGLESKEAHSASSFHVRGTSFLVKIVMLFSQMYALAAWSAYSVLRTMRFARLPETRGWIYYLTAFIICEGALGVIARKEEYNGFLSILHSIMAMGAFVIFAFNPHLMGSMYSWLIRLVGVEL
ncbi:MULTISPECIES: hypothetical protein [Aminobacterium]|uniref:Uncharacterized protein n=1 Tax=Aminobacterium colombiense (strain DSM 12261 / ALA-1) TaxID=572547 RepID=D5ECV9_AMICL|nr:MULTISPECIES: hypothetical protein [Aminobacterium]MDD2379191.1 hypothetical protein [Aminobacterium colombiense]ADE56391.1 hypothetical protein Amico_0246 [Aminobacterium colombiense DSM 12261]MDD3767903.1 hypothetical protein [Aminobacterium colombiense]MDD4265424.1 hypothetical protein [Aminobacterium colombiense]MDD4586121.1 hypothetical protein [Aminobacterium colombiense]